MNETQKKKDGRTRQRSGLAVGKKPQADDGRLRLFFSSLGPAILVRDVTWPQYNTPERASLLRARLLALMRLTGIFRFAKIFFCRYIDTNRVFL